MDFQSLLSGLREKITGGRIISPLPEMAEHSPLPAAMANGLAPQPTKPPSPYYGMSPEKARWERGIDMQGNRLPTPVQQNVATVVPRRVDQTVNSVLGGDSEPDELSELESRTMETFKKYNIPLRLAYGVASAEGGKIGDNNFTNLGAVDSDPNKAIDFKSIEEAATASARLLSGTADTTFYGNGAPGKQQFADAYALRDDPEAMIQAVYQAGFAGEPKTWKQRSIDSKPRPGAGIYYDHWDEFVKDTPGWKRWSKR